MLCAAILPMVRTSVEISGDVRRYEKTLGAHLLYLVKQVLAFRLAFLPKDGLQAPTTEGGARPGD
jgi:hypothetical protein